MGKFVERFIISQLHGRKTIDAQINDGILILVGENGSGKTTFLRILFYFLSGRWNLLTQFKFDYIEASIDGVTFRINYDELDSSFRSIIRNLDKNIPENLYRRISNLKEVEEFYDPELEMELMMHRYPEIKKYLSKEFYYSQIKSKKINKQNKAELQKKKEAIKNAVQSQILYLPTYRRIERELDSIFESREKDDFRRPLEKYRQTESDDSYIELVEFGMRDVQRAIDRTLGKLKDFARESLNNLTLGYLGEVVNREYEHNQVQVGNEISEDTIKSVLNRIDEKILKTPQKEHLFNEINSIRHVKKLGEREKIIYHYFSKLLSFQNSLEEKENQISKFCELCSSYMPDKKFIYESQSFNFTIKHAEQVEDSPPINLSDLSSGEKQIVSLFSHLYLSGKNKFLVLIDEPELSLSVFWQNRFLRDIISGNLCNGLVAVTHSPFIYDNDLISYAHSIEEFLI